MILRKDKRGISLMISYVLLIVIALTLAAGIFAWLKLYVPQEDAVSCPSDTSISIKTHDCVSLAPELTYNSLDLEIENRGLFNIENFFIRLSNEEGKLPTTLPSDTVFNLDYGTLVDGKFQLTMPLAPGQTIDIRVPYGTGSPNDEINNIERVQIQPFILDNTKIITCDSGIDLIIKKPDCTGDEFPEYEEGDPEPDLYLSFDGDTTAYERGSVTYTSGVIGNALTLNGEDGNYLEIPSTTGIEFGTENFLISFHLKPETSEARNVLNKREIQNGWMIISQSNGLSFYKENFNRMDQIPLIQDDWNEIMIIRENNQGKVCINSNCNPTNGFFGGVSFGEISELLIGCDQDGVACLEGSIDELKIYKGLTEQEIADLSGE